MHLPMIQQHGFVALSVGVKDLHLEAALYDSLVPAWPP